jgi:penicillin-binding protein 2
LTKYLKTADQDWYKQRLVRIAFCVAGTFCLIFIRLFYLQVINGEELRRLSENNCIRLQSIDPSRGMIFDRNGILLVDNRPAFDLNIVLKDAKSVEQTVKKLSKYISVPESELMSKIENDKTVSSYKPILLKIRSSRGCCRCKTSPTLLRATDGRSSHRVFERDKRR